MKPLFLGLSAVSYGAIASAHICDCVAHAPRTEAYHWMAAVGYTVLGLIAVVVVIRQFIGGSATGNSADINNH